MLNSNWCVLKLIYARFNRYLNKLEEDYEHIFEVILLKVIYLYNLKEEKQQERRRW